MTLMLFRHNEHIVVMDNLNRLMKLVEWMDQLVAFVRGIGHINILSTFIPYQTIRVRSRRYSFF